jgi:hypothetical protein
MGMGKVGKEFWGFLWGNGKGIGFGIIVEGLGRSKIRYNGK